MHTSKKIKKTISCKDVIYKEINSSIIDFYIPKFGDVALFEVVKIGKHKTVQSESKHIKNIFEGDLILAAFANRYATDQFEGYLPTKPTRFLDILGSGGAIGIVASKNAAFEEIKPTRLELIGYSINENNEVVNTVYYNNEEISFTGELPDRAQIILSVGSTMESGKSTSAAFLARGINNAGRKVGFIKLTGTCFTKDKDLVNDCGADMVLDFIDAGFPSTYMLSKQELLNLYQFLLNKFKGLNYDYIIVEIADGLVQRETEFLLNDVNFMKTIYKTIFSSTDSLAAFWGTDYLTAIGFRPAIISGRLTMSPLLIQEVKRRCEIPVLTLDELASENIIEIIENNINA
jgi:hypothetical protein